MRGRLVATVAFLAAMFVTTLFGYSDHFPFTPMTQFAGSVGNGDDFVERHLVGGAAGERPESIPFRDFGIRRAEVTGQLRHFGSDAEPLLEHLARAYEEFNPDNEPLATLQLVEDVYLVRDHRPHLIERTVIGTWRD